MIWSIYRRCKWFKPRSFDSLSSVIVRISEVRKRTVVVVDDNDWCSTSWAEVIFRVVWIVKYHFTITTNKCWTKTNLAADNEQYTKWNVATVRNLNTNLATKNGDVNNHIAEHHLQTNHRIEWDSAECVTYSTDYSLRTETPLNRC